jgi:hypothetical protein
MPRKIATPLFETAYSRPRETLIGVTPFCKIDLCRSEIYIYFTPKTHFCKPHLRNLPLLMPFSALRRPQSLYFNIYTTRGIEYYINCNFSLEYVLQNSANSDKMNYKL